MTHRTTSGRPNTVLCAFRFLIQNVQRVNGTRDSIYNDVSAIVKRSRLRDPYTGGLYMNHLTIA